MFATLNRTIRISGFAFAVLMAVAVNGSMLLKFDAVAANAAMAQNTLTSGVAVLDKVTVVGHRI